MRECPQYIARKSIWSVIYIWRILLFGVVIPGAGYFAGTYFNLDKLYCYIGIGAWELICLIVMICKIVKIKCHYIAFFDDKVIEKWGVFSIQRKSNIFTAVLTVDIKQSFRQRIFRFGSINVDMVGPWDIDLTRIKKPKKLQNYLNTRIARVRNMHHIMPS